MIPRKILLLGGVLLILTPVTLFSLSAREGTKRSYAYEPLWQKNGSLADPETEGYLQRTDAPLFYAMAPHYVVQKNSASCSLASAVILLNSVRALQAEGYLEPVTQEEIWERVKNPVWEAATAEEGSGVTLDQLGLFLRELFSAYGIEDVSVEVTHIEDKSEKTRYKMHQDLLALAQENEVITLLVMNFKNSEENVGHFSPLGGYDPHTHTALVLDVDREGTGPYWITEERLFEAVHTLDNGEKGSLPVYRGYIGIRLYQ